MQLLAAAGGAADEASDEDIGFLTQPSPVPVEQPKEREWRLGVRAGLFATTASGSGWDPAVCFGAFYRAGWRKLVYELGLDLAGLKTSDGSTESQLVFLRGEMLFGGREPPTHRGGRAYSFYLLAGAQGISERAESTTLGTTESRTGAGLNVGLGIGSPKGSWDVRAVYSVVLGSDNATGDLLIAAGVSF